MSPKSSRRSRTKDFSFLLVAFCFVLGCKSRSDDPFGRQWEKLAEEPADGAWYLKQAANSQCVWKVGGDTVTHRITIEPKEHLTTQSEVRLQTDAGMLLGTDHGEWGGNLSITDAKGVPVKSILEENVIDLLKVKSGVLVFTGLRHLSVDQGSVWLYGKNADQSWSIKKLYEFDGEPTAVYGGDRDILVATHHGIFHLDQSLGLRQIATLPMFQTYPNSITEDAKGRIYIGMNAFVVRLVPTKAGYSHDWFTRSECLRDSNGD